MIFQIRYKHFKKSLKPVLKNIFLNHVLGFKLVKIDSF
jgi:hypothetical protein